MLSNSHSTLSSPQFASVRLDLRLIERVLVEAVRRFVQRILASTRVFSIRQILVPLLPGLLIAIVDHRLPNDQCEQAGHNDEQHNDRHEEEKVLNVRAHLFAEYLDVNALDKRLEGVDKLVFTVILVDHNAAFHQRWFKMAAIQLNCYRWRCPVHASVGLRRSIRMCSQIGELFHHVHVELAVLLAMRFVRSGVEGMAEHTWIVESTFLVTGRALVAEAAGPNLRWHFAGRSSLTLTSPTVAGTVSIADLAIDRTHTGRLVHRALTRFTGPAVDAVAFLIAAPSLTAAGQTIAILWTRIIVTFAMLSINQETVFRLIVAQALATHAGAFIRADHVIPGKGI